MLHSSRWSIGLRLTLGFLAVFVVSGAATFLTLRASTAAADALGEVGRLTEQARRIARAGALVREFYIHQAHLALGLHPEAHLTKTRTARRELGAAVEALARVPAGVDMARVHRELAALDVILDQRFLPALRAGDTERARHIHHHAVEGVDRLVGLLEGRLAVVADTIAAAERAAEERARAATRQGAWVLGLNVLLALGIAAWVTRIIAVPVRRLRDAAARVADGGAAVPVAGPPEVAALGNTLNAMLVALEDQRRARSTAEAMAAIGRVSAGIAHEINNPLGVILGHARLIEQAGGAAAEDAGVIAREARLCQEIVRALLDYARPGALRREPVDVAALLDAAAERHGVTPLIEGELPPLRGDAVRLGQLVGNLLSNAARFGTASLAARAIDEGLEVIVSDDGPGVPAADVERVFEPFFSSRPGGAGLGLAIARSIAEAHGGTLRASAGPGGRFVLILPVEAS